MGALITVVGNSGVGKTTLTRALCVTGELKAALEEHQERPFQQLFSDHLQRYGLANQVDYLLYRGEQEYAIRRGNAVGVQDGGLDTDFYVFTRHFFHKGYLSPAEHALCQRLYTLLRSLLPPPDVIVRLVAPLDVIARRHAQRGRTLEIATMEDLAHLEALLDEWMAGLTSSPVLEVDASQDDFCSSPHVRALRGRIDQLLTGGSALPT